MCVVVCVEMKSSVCMCVYASVKGNVLKAIHVGGHGSRCVCVCTVYLWLQVTPMIV